jgi:LysM repeat protein
MNTPSPLIPQGALPTTRSRSHIRIAVFTILAVHLVLLFALLMAGCKKTSDQTAKTDLPADTGAPIPPFDPNALPNTGSNPPAVASTGTVPAVATSTPAPTPLPPPIQTKQEETTKPSTPVTSGLSEGTEHTIIKGDSFYTLSKKYNVSQRAIANANTGVDPARLKIGQKIKIPPASPSSATPAGNGATASTGGNEKLYTVKSGDTLTKIAKSNGVTAKALRAENNLKTDQIKVGQKLKIPSKESNAVSAAGATGTNL